jgi:adenylate kinase
MMIFNTEIINIDRRGGLRIIYDNMVYDNNGDIFVGGIHGSGKTYLCEKFISLYGYYCISASRLIADGHGEVNTEKTVSDIDENQRLLLAGLHKARSDYSHLVIDGHFYLLDERGRVKKIHVEIFEVINPDLIILALPPISVIDARLNSRSKKLKLYGSCLEDFQRQELQYAKEVAEQLGVPFELIDTSRDDETLSGWIDRIFRDTAY